LSSVVDDFNDIRFDTRGTAKHKAKTALREQNKSEWVCELQLVGATEMVAGLTFMVEGYGVFDGKYIVETAEHSVAGDSGYTTKVKGRRVLEGY
jgi:hypothetical protein